jgi:hypothetical protein
MVEGLIGAVALICGTLIVTSLIVFGFPKLFVYQTTNDDKSNVVALVIGPLHYYSSSTTQKVAKPYTPVSQDVSK